MTMLTACGMLPNEITDSSKKHVQEPIEAADLTEQRETRTHQQISQLLERQDYVGTINLIQRERHQGVAEQSLAKEYLQAANGILSQTDTLMKHGQYSKAALLLRTVQASYPRSLDLQKQITASPVQITNKLDLCTEKIMVAGVAAYRSGEFATAIDIWQQVLEYNPQHQAAKNSIETTQLQLSNLKSLNGKN
jgi:tetratricopeptide (TPR) repeat protein